MGRQSSAYPRGGGAAEPIAQRGDESGTPVPKWAFRPPCGGGCANPPAD
jgi:hypothetical protein